MLIKLRWQHNLPATVKILDPMGTVCKEIIVYDSIQKIDLSFLRHGEYILQISNVINRFTKKIKV